MDKLTAIRIELTKAGYIDAGQWHKPRYSVRFMRGDTPCAVPISTNRGDKRPIGQDVIDAMAPYIKRRQVTETELLTAPVRD